MLMFKPRRSWGLLTFFLVSLINTQGLFTSLGITRFRMKGEHLDTTWSSELFSKNDDGIVDIVRLSERERLQKVLSRAGVASRRGSEKVILDGRVSVNGKIIFELGCKVNPLKDIIAVDGKKIQLLDTQGIFWIMLHKPKDTLTTLEDTKDRTTIADLVPKAKTLRLLPVGRLERDASGLLILTNENGWIHPLTHPSYRLRRRYEVVVKGLPTETELNTVRINACLPGNETPIFKANQVRILDQDVKSNLSLLDITLEDSKPRQIEKILQSISCTYLSSKRCGFGPLTLRGLRKGQWRELTSSEINNLKKSCIPASNEQKLPPSSHPETSVATKTDNSNSFEKLRGRHIARREFRGRAGKIFAFHLIQSMLM